MISLIYEQKAAALLFLLLLAVTCAPVWGVNYYVNHDGSGHIYISFVMGELLRGNQYFTDVFQLNSLAVPNSTGHWIMTGLLAVFPPMIVTKIIATLTLGLFTGAVVWLRFRTSDDKDLVTPTLFAFAVGLNWLWMQGSYNFILAGAASVFSLGLFYRWRERIQVWHVAVLALLLAFVFVSHLVSFAVLAGSLLVLAFAVSRGQRRRSALAVIAALVPTLPLVFAFRSISNSGEPFRPFWRSLADPTSIGSWAAQLIAGDPFVLISRKAIPFYTVTSSTFSILSPIVWIMAAIALMLFSTVLASRQCRSRLRSSFPFVLLASGAFVAAIMGPDDFGLSNGSILRERMLIFGMCFLVPVFSVSISKWLKWCARAFLIYVILFQTAALWEYSLSADAEAREFIAARDAIPENSSIASVVVVADAPRFHSMPSTQLNNYVGIGRDVIVWDNYELGHYMFPVVTANENDRDFVFGFTTSNVFYLNNPREEFDSTLPKLRASLSSWNQRFDYLVLFGDDPRLWPVLDKWFDTNAFFESGRVKVLRHK